MNKIVIVGGNIAGLRTAETLRRNGFDGALTMVSAEPYLPYDRPPLSKQVLTGELDATAVPYRPQSFFDDNGITVLLGTTAIGLDLLRRRVLLDADDLPYDGLLIATGARARTIAGAEGLAGVHVIRTIDDALAIRREMAAGPRVVIVGGGVIGSEVASSARARGLQVTLVEADRTLMRRAVGESMGDVLARLHTENGVHVICGRGVSALLGDGRVEAARLDDGTLVEADLVVVGVGVVPNVEWLQNTGLLLDNGLACDRDMHVHGRNIFAAGDVASWRNGAIGHRLRGEQWTSATEQAEHAARQLGGVDPPGRPCVSSMYFWSDQCGTRIQAVGGERGHIVEVLLGSIDAGKFVAGYRTGERLTGLFSVNRPKQFRKLRPLVEAGATWSQALAAADENPTEVNR